MKEVGGDLILASTDENGSIFEILVPIINDMQERTEGE